MFWRGSESGADGPDVYIETILYITNKWINTSVNKL